MSYLDSVIVAIGIASRHLKGERLSIGEGEEGVRGVLSSYHGTRFF